MSPTKVAIVGAAGQTGSTIVDALLESGNFSVVALTRPSSVSKPANQVLRERGVEIVPADLAGPQDALAETLKGIEVLISAVGAHQQYDQIPLADAAKKAGVRRFIPCGFITVCAPRGVMTIRDWKEDIYNHIKFIGLGYTFVDVGWWYQVAYPRLPSGKIDYCTGFSPCTNLVGDGNTPNALTDVRDIGRYVARIIVDDRTLNKYVFVYNELWTPNSVYDTLERMSGETIPREFDSDEKILAGIAEGKAQGDFKTGVNEKGDFGAHLRGLVAEYQYSWGVRGDNTPEVAKYLGYLTSKELYPDFEFLSFEQYLDDMIQGRGLVVYEEQMAYFKALHKPS